LARSSKILFLAANLRNKLFIVLLIGMSIWMGACSQNSNSFVAKTYHNLLARDNAFFLARERMKEVERQVYDQRLDNFNEILEVIPPFDSTKTKGIAELDDIVKKASLPIRRHKNSVYVDDSYLLVGRCRMYKAEFKLGVETFKFVNHSSEDQEARIEALIHLMRAYIAQKEWNNAFTVSERIEELKPTSKKNLREFYLTRAQYYRHEEDYDKCAKDLAEMLKYASKKDVKSRAHFILGQIYQSQNNDSSSYKNYRKVLKLNPPYDFEFYTKLYMTQVGLFSGKKTKRKDVEKYFKKLMADEKNEEYRDKICYEEGRYEYKQKNYAEAEAYFKKALTYKGANRYQTGASYLALGELYFEKMNKYQLSKMYYDSAVANWDSNHKRYKEISRRHKILTEFAEQINIVERQDSLLKLAKMDSVALNAFVDKAIERDIAEAKRKAEEEKRKKEKEEDFNFTGITDNAGGLTSTTSWYFGNPATVSNGYSEFLKKWGKRKLEDHWRRSTKDEVVEFKSDSALLAEENGEQLQEEEIADVPKIDRSTYFKDIPFTAEAQAKSNDQIKDALYHLGKIYNFKLYLEDSAVVTFKKQMKRYPGNNHEPEELYLLYLIGQEKKDAKLMAFAKKELRSNYPNSSYTKLIDNPNYLVESKVNSKAAGQTYKSAYSSYKNKDTMATDSIIMLYYSTYKDGTTIDDKFALLSILNRLHKKGNRTPIVDSLDQFITFYKTSTLVDYAKNVKDLLTGKKTDEGPIENEPMEQPVLPDENIIQQPVIDENAGKLMTPQDEQ
jgi:tetratricopeptide (TPR) repeat protein